MDPVDAIAHAVVTVTSIVAVTVLGLTGVISGDTVVVVLLALGGAVGALSTADALIYGRRDRAK